MPQPVEIRIIATEANRRGDLFGRLMSDLFLSLGYDNVRMNIQRSGREIDIDAEHRLEARRAIAECKALEEKVGGAEVNKLAGKLRPERSRHSGHTVAGYFISRPASQRLPLIKKVNQDKKRSFYSTDRRWSASLLKEEFLFL